MLKVSGDELIGRIPEGCQALPHLALIRGSGLADKNIRGLAHCQRVFRTVTESLARVGCKELLTRCFGWKHKAGIIAALLALDQHQGGKGHKTSEQSPCSDHKGI